MRQGPIIRSGRANELDCRECVAILLLADCVDMHLKKRGLTVLTSKGVVDATPVKSTTISSKTLVSPGKAVLNGRHELVEAQVEVLRTYMEKKSTERLVEALERLIECTRASFREEEALMECLTGAPDRVHREKHDGVLAQMLVLRDYAIGSDRGHLLGQLIHVDRQLTSHLSDAVQAPDRQLQH